MRQIKSKKFESLENEKLTVKYTNSPPPQDKTTGEGRRQDQRVAELFKCNYSGIFAYISVTVKYMENLYKNKNKVEKISYKKAPCTLFRTSDTFKVMEHKKQSLKKNKFFKKILKFLYLSSDILFTISSSFRHMANWWNSKLHH